MSNSTMDLWGNTVIERPDLDILWGKQIYLHCIVCGFPEICVDARWTDRAVTCGKCGSNLNMIRRGNRYSTKVMINGKLLNEEQLVNAKV